MPESEADASGLISVKTELVHRFVIGGILEEIKQRHRQPLPPVTESALERAQEALTDCDHRAVADNLATAVARAGYLARMIEGERFEPARQPSGYVEGKLHEATMDAGHRDVAGDVALELARQEPEERADPDDPRAVSWHIPGPGGHVRHYLALETAEWLIPPPGQAGGGGRGPALLKRYWMYGFFLRCCEEASPTA
jgi:hypothetical protein